MFVMFLVEATVISVAIGLVGSWAGYRYGAVLIATFEFVVSVVMVLWWATWMDRRGVRVREHGVEVGRHYAPWLRVVAWDVDGAFAEFGVRDHVEPLGMDRHELRSEIRPGDGDGLRAALRAAYGPGISRREKRIERSAASRPRLHPATPTLRHFCACRAPAFGA